MEKERKKQKERWLRSPLMTQGLFTEANADPQAQRRQVRTGELGGSFLQREAPVLSRWIKHSNSMGSDLQRSLYSQCNAVEDGSLSSPCRASTANASSKLRMHQFLISRGRHTHPLLATTEDLRLEPTTTFLRSARHECLTPSTDTLKPESWNT